MATDEDKNRSKTIASMLLPHVAPLLLAPSRQAGPSEVVHSGSGALVDTGQMKLLITCEHVWTAFREYCEKTPDAVVGMSTGKDIHVINGLPLIAINKDLDIAVLDLGAGDILAGSAKQFCGTGSWPPQRPAPGDLLVAIGFPGCLRRPTEDGNDLQLRTLDIEDDIVSVSDRHIALADEDRVREIMSHLDEEAPDDLSLGGISGCPAFVYRNGRFELAGIVYEADEKGLGILYASHSDFIAATGEIDWSRVPPQ